MKKSERIGEIIREGNLWGKWKQLAGELNRQKVLTSNDEPWTPKRIERFCKKYVEAPVKQDTIPVAETTTTKTSRKRVAPSIKGLTSEDLDALNKILAWWQGGGEDIMEKLSSVNVGSLVARPAFPGAKMNSGIRVNRALLRAAVAKAKTPEQAVQTGASLSSLIEVLLWSYLGNDEQFLKLGKE